MKASFALPRPLLMVFFGLLLGFALMGGARAGDFVDNALLDKLFAQLKVAPDAEAARRIDQQIWGVWSSPSDPDLARRMQQVATDREAMNIADAITLLNKIVVDFPTYAEGWNERATLFYMLDDYDRSLADIDKVLQYEPRHFGALSGRAVIYLQQHKRALALKDITAALALHPFLSEKSLFPELMHEVTHV
ncbi:MAG TPA: hypothetical protein VGM83_17445 [Devosiaceae bacterium]|jgi:tetratricopeptide (TPR) repeat protein